MAVTKTMQLLASPRNSTATERLFIKEKKHRRRNPNKVSKSEERNLLLRTWKQQEVTRHPNLKGLETRSVSRTVRCSWGFLDHWEPQWLFRSLSSNDLSHLHLPAKQMVGATKWDLLATFLEALGLSVSQDFPIPQNSFGSSLINFQQFLRFVANRLSWSDYCNPKVGDSKAINA